MDEGVARAYQCCNAFLDLSDSQSPIRRPPEEAMTLPGEQPPIPSQYSVSYERRKINHLLHLILTLLTFGLWGFVWLTLAVIAAMVNPERKVTAFYGASHPGHPGQADIPPLPQSETDLYNPRPLPTAAYDRKIKQFRTASWVGGVIGVLTIVGDSKSLGAGVFLLAVTAAVAGFLYYQARKLAPQDTTERNPSTGT